MNSENSKNPKVTDTHADMDKSKLCDYPNVPTEKLTLDKSSVFVAGSNAEYRYITNGKFPIIAMEVLPVNFASILMSTDDARRQCNDFTKLVEKLAECGFNAFIQGGNMPQTIPLYKAGAANGLIPIPSSNYLHGSMREIYY